MRKPSTEPLAPAKELLLVEQDVQRLEQELAGKYYLLGKCIYEVADRRVDEINRMVDELVELRIRQRSLEERTPCPRCATANPAGQKYCGHCGRLLAKPEGELPRE